MKKRVDVYLILLFVWFTLDLTGLSVSNFTMVRGTGFLGVNGIWWSVYSILLLIYFFANEGSEKLLLAFLSFWVINEYFKEWHMIFTKKIQEEMIYLPNMYHLILQGFLIVSLVFLIKYIFFEKNKTYIEFVVIKNNEEEKQENEIQEILSVE